MSIVVVRGLDEIGNGVWRDEAIGKWSLYMPKDRIQSVANVKAVRRWTAFDMVADD